MVNAQELRIGNVVGVYTGDEWAKYKEIIDHDDLAVNACAEYYPIHISPEVLDACGFRMFPRSPYERKLEYDNDHWICKRNNGGVYLGYELEAYIEIELPHIEYLHELQNLYRWLTGTELEYSPTNQNG